ncbi:triphosphoribosyl-dephospho-CoA synthase [Methanosphaerula palustris]|uniref:Triphosphoribosyl-dephospho-CoA protein n=1 Tax=Methanosphaerula palustris (strain ATCC BAA-1556 / DSM 19958 / E1-9c) TaxID=521011 RepID=B8GFK3_METPE|nr:triphosphoribosyl-dephospho-CoA synthase [Methanosphaerula palustris]ACL16051.1 triphosphoribosyl-dephospho-CoA protein [Methanosphaerula palustris E1-9c]
MRSKGASRADQAQLAMMLEVCASPKPGNVDRCHDYPDTRLEHFLASTLMVRPVLERAEQRATGIGTLIREAVQATSFHRGGNTHFGAFILLMPLICGGDLVGAVREVSTTTVQDAVEFYRAFGLTEVRVCAEDELDVHDPAAIEQIRTREITLYDLMVHSAEKDMVAREWVNGFALTRRTADFLLAYEDSRAAIPAAFLNLLATEQDSFIVKKLGRAKAEQTRLMAAEVLRGQKSVESLDAWCIAEKVNPGSLADIIIASIFTALGEGWQWD